MPDFITSLKRSPKKVVKIKEVSNESLLNEAICQRRQFSSYYCERVVAAEKINFAFSSIIGSQTPLWIAKE